MSTDKLSAKRQAQQKRLAASHQERVETVRKKHGLALAELELSFEREMEEIKRIYKRELADLWRKQGRQIGPWASHVLADGTP